jgi:DNA-binding MarR family transcriptional regulator
MILMAKAVPAERQHRGLGEVPRGRRHELARDVWRSIVEAVLARREYMQVQATRCGLTLPQAHVLRVLGSGPPQTSTGLARVMACDASNITGLVDRLEARFLIERRSMRGDRRVKIINITARGSAVISRLNRTMLKPPSSFMRLAPKELSQLSSLLAQVLTGRASRSAPPSERRSGHSA